MPRKTSAAQNADNTADENTAADVNNGADTAKTNTGAPVPEVIKNHNALSEREVRDFLAEGFASISSQAMEASAVLGQASLLAGDDKAKLIGANMVVLGWRFNEGQFADEFVSVLVLTEHDEFYVFNDSSAGVYRQLQNATERLGRQYGPIHCPHGLRTSDYWYDEATGETFTVKPDDRKTIPARTFYLA
ncbi:hypothetical protein HUO13_26115 [Saccharopolyspora erythraea]|uniref:hypothetical protein n=1 Tax=Saccharopolyspora erythraea TaxID=1836 RepID=UPI001BA4E4F4|nr:hypothetical protein [Saccharopolyspora erythraea]QUH03827.1 hypothetical protein HUO13_26115 [Saccharopolyspora erythraea]